MSTNQGRSEKSLFIDSGTRMNFGLPVNRNSVVPTKNSMGAASAPMSRKELDAKARVHMSANPGVDYLGAVKAVQRDMAAVPAKSSTPRPDTAMSRQFIDATAKKYMTDHPGTTYVAAIKSIQPGA